MHFLLEHTSTRALTIAAIILTPAAGAYGAQAQSTYPVKPVQLSVRDLVALAHRNPGKLNNATVGTGAAIFLASEFFLSITKTEILNVPFKGAALSETSLLGGQVDMSFIGAPSAIPFLRSSSLRALATTGNQRLEIAPDLPTLAQAGVAGYELTLQRRRICASAGKRTYCFLSLVPFRPRRSANLPPIRRES